MLMNGKSYWIPPLDSNPQLKQAKYYWRKLPVQFCSVSNIATVKIFFDRSLDGLVFKRKRNTHVPLWNYTLFRFQVRFRLIKLVSEF